MPKFDVHFTETMTKTYTVEADTAEQAEELATEYMRGDKEKPDNVPVLKNSLDWFWADTSETYESKAKKFIDNRGL